MRTKPSIKEIESTNEKKATFGVRLADIVAQRVGSWHFIIIQIVIMIIWATLNTIALITQWDKYPFTLMNLFLSMEAALSTPIIIMSQNRQAAKDRLKADTDYETNRKAEQDILKLHKRLDEAKFEILHNHLEAIKAKLHIPLSPDTTQSDGLTK